MRNTLESRGIARTLVVTAIAGAAALGLTACQTGAQAPAPAPVVVPQHGPVDQIRPEGYAGRPADRIEEDLERRARAGELPTPGCRLHVLVEHPDGRYRLICTAPAPAE